MKKCTILVLALFLGLIVYSQPNQPNTPSAAVYNYSKYADIAPNLNTGAMSDYIPIGTVASGPLKQSIGLGYYFSGHRPTDIASPAGLGFQVLGGGAITRVIRGLDDFGPKGWLITGHETACGVCSSVDQDIIDEEVDGEADLYSVQVGDINLKFFIDADGVCHTIPRSDLKVEFISATGFDPDKIVWYPYTYFLLTDLSGTKYFFGSYYLDDPIPRVISATEQTNFKNKTHISAWYLYKIESHDGLHKIDLGYSHNSYSFYSLQDCQVVKYKHQNGSEGFVGNNSCKMSAEKVTITGKVLDIIKGNTSKVTLAYTADREDLIESANRLTSLTYESGTFKKTFTLDHDYFQGIGLSYSQASNHLELNDLNLTEFNTLNKKLKLNAISISGGTETIPSYKFDYYRQNGAITGTTTTFHLLDKSIDGYGFANGETSNNNKDHIIPATTVISDHETITFGHSGGIRNSNANFSITTGLYQMTLPTGGTITYEYEGNQYFDVTSNVGSTAANSASHFNCNELNIYDESDVSFTPTQDQIDYGVLHWNVQIDPTCTAFPTEVFVQIMQGDDILFERHQVVVSPQNDEAAIHMISPTLNSNTEYIIRLQVQHGTVSSYISYPTEGSDEDAGGIRLKKVTVDDQVSSTNIIRNFNYLDDQDNSSGRLYRIPAYGMALDGSGVQTFGVGNVLFSTSSIRPFTSYQGHYLGYQMATIDYNGNGNKRIEFFTDVHELLDEEFPPVPEQDQQLWGQNRATEIYHEDGSILTSSENKLAPTEYGTDAPGRMRVAQRIKIKTASGSPEYNFSKEYRLNTGTFRPEQIDQNLEGLTTSTEYTYSTSTHLQPKKVTKTYQNGDIYHTDITYNLEYNSVDPAYDSLESRNIIVPIEKESFINGVKSQKTTDLFVLFSNHPRLRETRRRYFDDQGNELLETDSYDNYNAQGLLSSSRKHGDLVATSYGYDSKAQLTSVGPTGLRKTFTYHPNSHLISSVTEVDGTTTSYEYDGMLRLKKITDPAGAETTWHYNISHNLFDITSHIKKTQTFPADDNGLSELTQLSERAYLDGLGRTLQILGRQQSPTGKDRATQMSYDNQGRLHRTYEMFESTESDGSYAAGASVFTQHNYEASPLNRLSSVEPPTFGIIQYTYGSNTTAITDAHEVEHAVGTLLKRTVIDGNDNKSITYTDVLGRKVLSRRTDNAETTSNHIDTKYAYDWKDRLTEVVPPGSTLGDSHLNFQYEYDKEGKTTRKKVPSKDWINYIYDNRDLLIGYQDSYMSSQTEEPWFIYQYDNFGRETTSGTHTAQPTVGNTTPSTIYTKRQYGSSGIDNGKVKEEEFRLLGSDDFIKYQHFYDEHGRLDWSRYNNPYALSILWDRTDYYYDGASSTVKVKEKTRLGDASSDDRTVTYSSEIDNDGRTKATHVELHGQLSQQLCELSYTVKDEVKTKYQGGDATSHLQKIDYAYWENGALNTINESSAVDGDLYGYRLNYHLTTDLDGRTSEQMQGRRNGDIAGLKWSQVNQPTDYHIYHYDHLDRLTFDHNEYVDEDAYNTSYTYDERGNLDQVTRRSKNVIIDDLQYSYNVNNKNQLTSITDSADADQGYIKSEGGAYQYDDNGNLISDPLKGISIHYNHLDLPKSITWEDGRSMELLYDAGGKLWRRMLKDSEGNNVQQRTYVGSFEMIGDGVSDDLLYAVMHNEGRLVNAGLEGMLPYLFLDHHQTTVHTFEADQIESVGIVIDETTLYDAAKCISLNNGFTVNHGAVFDATLVSTYPYSETWRLEYNISDHLGNLRITYSDLNGNGSIDPNTEILQSQSYYPYGLAKRKNLKTTLENKYQFNSIDHVGDFGLGWEMATYRTLDAAYGRWGQVDPYAESFYSMSPYCAMNNNPISYADPEGDIAFVPILVGMGVGALTHTGIHLATNNFTFNNWNWGSFAGSVVAGGVGGAVGPALEAARIGGFYGGAILGASTGFSHNLTSGLINGNLSAGGLAKSTLIGAGIGGLAGGIDAELRGYRFLDGRSKVLTERYQLTTGNTPTTEESPNQIGGQRPMSKGDAIERGEVGLVGNDRRVDMLGADINRGFEGDLRLRGNAYVPEGQEFYVNVDGTDVIRTSKRLRIDMNIPSRGRNISWGYRGEPLLQTTTQHGITFGVTVRPNSYLYITGNHRGWDGFLFWGR